MTKDEEDLAVALWLWRNKGARAPVYIAERIGTLALEGDAKGIARWKTIAATFQELVRGSRQ